MLQPYLIPVELLKYTGMEGSGRGYSFIPAGDVKLVAELKGAWMVTEPCDPINVASLGSWAAERDNQVGFISYK